MKSPQTPEAHTATVRLTVRQAAAIRRYLVHFPGIEVVAAPSFVRLTGTENDLCGLGAAISEDWPVAGYVPGSALWPSRRAVYHAIETALTVPATV